MNLSSRSIIEIVLALIVFALGHRRIGYEINGAGDRFRTDDLVLGKHALYQLSYTRSRGRTRSFIGRSQPSQSDRRSLRRRTNRGRPQRAPHLQVVVDPGPDRHHQRDPQHEHPEREGIDVEIRVVD